MSHLIADQFAHIHSCDSSREGQVLGIDHIPRLVKTVRNQGRLTASPINILVFMGREVS